MPFFDLKRWRVCADGFIQLFPCMGRCSLFLLAYFSSRLVRPAYACHINVTKQQLYYFLLLIYATYRIENRCRELEKS